MRESGSIGPGSDWSILGLVAGFFIVALLTVLWWRTRAGADAAV